MTIKFVLRAGGVSSHNDFPDRERIRREMARFFCLDARAYTFSLADGQSAALYMCQWWLPTLSTRHNYGDVQNRHSKILSFGEQTYSAFGVKEK